MINQKKFIILKNIDGSIIAGTISEMPIWGSSVGSDSLPKNFLVTSREINIKVRGFYTLAAAPVSNMIIFNFYVNATLIVSTGLIVLPPNVAVPIVEKYWELDLKILALNPFSDCFICGKIMFVNELRVASFYSISLATFFIDNTIENLLSVTAQWDESNANNNLTTLNATIESDTGIIDL